MFKFGKNETRVFIKDGKFIIPEKIKHEFTNFNKIYFNELHRYLMHDITNEIIKFMELEAMQNIQRFIAFCEIFFDFRCPAIDTTFIKLFNGKTVNNDYIFDDRQYHCLAEPEGPVDLEIRIEAIQDQFKIIFKTLNSRPSIIMTNDKFNKIVDSTWRHQWMPGEAMFEELIELFE